MSSSTDQYNQWSHHQLVLAEVLDDARDGKLAMRWREELRAYVLGLPKLGGLAARSQPTAITTGSGDDRPKAMAADGSLIVRRGRAAAAWVAIDDETERLHQLYACAVLGVARREHALWEPYAAQGDWRRALNQWYADRIATLEQSRDIACAEPHRDGGMSQVLVAQQRDVIQAKYRAALNAGAGTDTGWREWFIGRIESWRPTDLRNTLRRRMMCGDNFNAWETLPQSWTAVHP